jgi:hypothetical protein
MHITAPENHEIVPALGLIAGWSEEMSRAKAILIAILMLLVAAPARPRSTLRRPRLARVGDAMDQCLSHQS